MKLMRKRSWVLCVQMAYYLCVSSMWIREGCWSSQRIRCIYTRREDWIFMAVSRDFLSLILNQKSRLNSVSLLTVISIQNCEKNQKRWVYMKVHWKSKTWYKWKRFAKAAAAAAKSLQSSPTLCDPIDSSPPGSPVPGILQARTLEWVAISSSNTWEWKVKVKSLSRVRLLGTPWTAAYQAPPSMGFSRQEYWSGVPLLSPTYERSIYLFRFFLISLGSVL